MKSKMCDGMDPSVLALIGPATAAAARIAAACSFGEMLLSPRMRVSPRWGIHSSTVLSGPLSGLVKWSIEEMVEATLPTAPERLPSIPLIPLMRFWIRSCPQLNAPATKVLNLPARVKKKVSKAVSAFAVPVLIFPARVKKNLSKAVSALLVQVLMAPKTFKKKVSKEVSALLVQVLILPAIVASHLSNVSSAVFVQVLTASSIRTP